MRQAASARQAAPQDEQNDSDRIQSPIHDEQQSDAWRSAVRPRELERRLIALDDFFLESRYLSQPQTDPQTNASSAGGILDTPFVQGVRPPLLPKDADFVRILRRIDIRRITNRILATGLPWQNKSSVRSHRCNVADLSAFLNTRYPSRYLVWNLAGDTHHGAYDIEPFHARIVVMPLSKAYNLSLKTVIDACRSIHAWLSLDPANVAVIHCSNGVGRTGLVIACFLRFADIIPDAKEAFEYYAYRRFALNPSAFADRSWVSVSLQRYIDYFNNLSLLGGSVPNPLPLRMHRIIINGIPNFDGKGDCNPGLEIYENGRVAFSTATAIAHPRSQAAAADAAVLAQALVQRMENVIIFRIPAYSPLHLERDIQIRIFHTSDSSDSSNASTQRQVATMLSFSFHSGFIPPNGIVRVGISDLEISRHDLDENKFPNDFAIDLIISEGAPITAGAAGIDSYEASAKLKLSYSKSMDSSLPKSLARLVSYHRVRINEAHLKSLESRGVNRVVACHALQQTRNDLVAANALAMRLCMTHPELNSALSSSDRQTRSSTSAATGSTSVPITIRLRGKSVPSGKATPVHADASGVPPITALADARSARSSVNNSFSRSDVPEDTSDAMSLYSARTDHTSMISTSHFGTRSSQLQQQSLHAKPQHLSQPTPPLPDPAARLLSAYGSTNATAAATSRSYSADQDQCRSSTSSSTSSSASSNIVRVTSDRAAESVRRLEALLDQSNRIAGRKTSGPTVNTSGAIYTQANQSQSHVMPSMQTADDEITPTYARQRSEPFLMESGVSAATSSVSAVDSFPSRRSSEDQHQDFRKDDMDHQDLEDDDMHELDDLLDLDLYNIQGNQDGLSRNESVYGDHRSNVINPSGSMRNKSINRMEQLLSHDKHRRHRDQDTTASSMSVDDSMDTSHSDDRSARSLVVPNATGHDRHVSVTDQSMQSPVSDTTHVLMSPASHQQPTSLDTSQSSILVTPTVGTGSGSRTKSPGPAPWPAPPAHLIVKDQEDDEKVGIEKAEDDDKTPVAAPPPPPPPPPPPMAPPPPPPPPGISPGASPQLSDGPKIRARAKLHWDEIRDIKNSVWKELDIESELSGRSVKLDVKRFEELFCIVPDQDKRKQPGTNGSTKKAFMVQKAQFTTFLELRRANNISIGLSRFTRRGMTTEMLFDAIGRMDESVLSSDDLLTLQSLLPTPDEKAMAERHLSGSKNGKSHRSRQADASTQLPLAPAETFVVQVAEHRDIPMMLLAFLFRLQLPVEGDDVLSKLRRLTSISNEIKASESFKVILRTVLELGNLTNYQYGIGGVPAGYPSYRPWMGREARALGFKIEGLARLRDVKSADGKWSLMTFLIDMVERDRHDVVVDMTSSFGDLSIVRQYDIKEMCVVINAMTVTLRQMYAFRDKRIASDSPPTEFDVHLRHLIDNAEALIATIKTEFAMFVMAWQEALQYLGESMDEYIVPALADSANSEAPTPSSSNKKQAIYFYTTLDVFFQGFKDAVEEMRRRREEEAKRVERERRAKEDRERRARLKAEREAAAASASSTPTAVAFGDADGGLLRSSSQPDVASDAAETPSTAFMRRAGEATEMFKRLSMMPTGPLNAREIRRLSRMPPIPGSSDDDEDDEDVADAPALGSMAAEVAAMAASKAASKTAQSDPLNK